MTNTASGTGVTSVVVVFDDGADDSWPEELGLVVSDEERAFARALVVEHLAVLAERDAFAQAIGWGPVEGCEVDPLTPDELVLGLAGPAHGSDLPLLASVHPGDLESDAARLAYVAGLDRVAAFVAAKRAEVLVAFAGVEPCGDYLVEVAGEHEVAIARRCSKYAAGRDIEVARSLGTTFRRFAAALLAGEISEGRCRTLVERTRDVTDPGVLAAIESRVLSKATRLPVGTFGDEVARAITALDADAVARHRRAKDSRCVYSRPLPDGLGFLGFLGVGGAAVAAPVRISCSLVGGQDAATTIATRSTATATSSAWKSASGEVLRAAYTRAATKPATTHTRSSTDLGAATTARISVPAASSTHASRELVRSPQRTTAPPRPTERSEPRSGSALAMCALTPMIENTATSHAGGALPSRP